MGLESLMSRYGILLNKPVEILVDETANEPWHFMGVCSRENRFVIVGGHVKKGLDSNIIFKTDSEFECDKNLNSPLLDFYRQKKDRLKVRIKNCLEESFLFNYFSNWPVHYDVVNVDAMWRDNIGAVSRFFKINHSTIIPENSYDSFLLALSLVIETIEQSGKSALI
jgi:hypothetical protein